MREPLTLDDPRHGTSGGYTNHGCRCGPCKAAHSQCKKDGRERKKAIAAGKKRPSNAGPRLIERDLLEVECWCRENVVLVPRSEVMQILTRSCSRASCHGPTDG